MTEVATSEFVLVEHDAHGTEESAPEWTNVRMEERDPSPVMVEAEGDDDDGAPRVSSSKVPPPPPLPCDIAQKAADTTSTPTVVSSDEVEMLLRLQKQLDDASVARFVSAENAKAAEAASGESRCDCLGGSSGIHRATCVLKTSQ